MAQALRSTRVLTAEGLKPATLLVEVERIPIDEPRGYIEATVER